MAPSEEKPAVADVPAPQGPARAAHEPARAYAHRYLLHQIVHLALEPGQAVSEAELSARLGISRTPIREALLELSRRRLIDIFPQRGTFVALIDPHYVEEIRFMRYVLEGTVAALCCESGAAGRAVPALEENLLFQRLRLQSSSFGELLRLDKEFHRTLFAACDKEVSYSILEEMMPHFDRERILSFEELEPAAIVEDHQGLLEAIRGRDAEAAQERMHRHLSRAQTDQKVLQERYPQYFKARAFSAPKAHGPSGP